MDKATTPQQLTKLDVNSKESLKEPKDIDAGTEVKSFLRKASVSAISNFLFESNVGASLPQLLQKYLRKVIYAIR